MLNELVYLVLSLFSCVIVYCVMRFRVEKMAGELADRIFNEKVDGLRGGFRVENEREMGFYRERMNIDFEKWKREHESEIREDSLSRSRASLKGKITEQIAPLLDEFPFILSDARYLGNPIDYIIFNGYSDADDIIDIVFVDIKTGNASLSDSQQKIKKAVEEKRVSWNTIRINI